ncbi:glycosyltransferase family 1 protein [Bosea sp. 117]|uniref:glycosyltransferase family 4 protein n=1 Tax=Bosea sp. 117 TaxID=1125973 RepID=UPI0018CC6C83|nr:glycosyltransferase family 1 protein [Bosea sp. 117]
MRLLLDVTRLCQRGRRTTPSGIDRVEYAYFSHAMGQPAGLEPSFVVFQKLIAGMLRKERARELRQAIVEAWSLDRGSNEEASYVDLCAELERPLRLEARTPLRVAAPSSVTHWPGRVLFTPRDMLRARVRLDRHLGSVPRHPPIYLHTSHGRLDQGAIQRWLSSAKIAPVFFLHDVIPIDYPEFCRPGENERHLSRLRAISNHARLVLVNSQATAAAASAQMDAMGLRVPPFAIVPLGVEDCFRDRSALTPPRSTHPYAVVVGTIEPRKNLAFLLAIWRRLVEKHGTRTPRLVIIGRRGWENENVLDYFERSTLLAPFVVEASDISDTALASVMAGACTMIAPSLAEGFNLPIAEALALGCPVIASDLPVHREIAEGSARFVDPLDGPGWMHAIEQTFLTENDASSHAAPPYASLSWREHVERALGFIAENVAA